LALARLGEARVYDLTEDQFVAVQCARQFPLAAEEVLRSHRWNFASARVALSRLAEAPAFGFKYAYALPTDCLRVLEVNGVSGAGEPGAEWEIEGRALLTDETSVKAIYIKRETNLMYWDSLAIEWLVLALAAKLAPTIQGGSTSKANELREEINRLAAPLARRIDANESKRENANSMEMLLNSSRTIYARGVGL
jgi:hypothetical protein